MVSTFSSFCYDKFILRVIGMVSHRQNKPMNLFLVPCCKIQIMSTDFEFQDLLVVH